jgi:small subunit ribosomal protein S14
MARKALIVKAQKEPKYKVRKYNRCPICGRPRGFIRQFGMCRLCFRTLALQGKIPGVRKASW